MSIGYKTPGEAHQQTEPLKKEWKVSMFLEKNILCLF